MKDDPLLITAIDAVSKACVVTRNVQASVDDSIKIDKTDQSPVTIADFAAQAVINNCLRDALPEALIAAEENAGMLRQPGHARLLTRVIEETLAVWPDATAESVLAAIDHGNHDASAAAYWTLDPIDGTKGYLRGQQYAISLALIENNEVRLGVLGCPNLADDFARPFAEPDPRGLIYFASKNGGTYRLPADGSVADASLVEPQANPESDAIRICESVEEGHSRRDHSAQIVEVLGARSTPVRIDSQCKYAVVARGQADAYLRLPTSKDYYEYIWDHAAGMLVAEEAGMVVSDISGQALDYSQGVRLCRNRGIVCASPSYHQRLIRVIRELGFT